MNEKIYEKVVNWYKKKAGVKQLEKKDELALKLLFAFAPTFISITIKASIMVFLLKWILSHHGFEAMIISIAIWFFIRFDMFVKDLKKWKQNQYH